MDFNERELVRDLAKRQALIAALPVMEAREKKWRALNDGKLDTPLVSVEFNGNQREVFPPCKCESELGRAIEKQLIRNITNHELLKDDRVVPNYFSVGPANYFTPFGIKTERVHVTHEASGTSFGYSDSHPVLDMQTDFHKFAKSEYGIDENMAEAKKYKAEIEEIIGDILPVKIQYGAFYFSLGNIFCHIMGMEKMMISLCDYPELFHKAIGNVTDEYLKYMDELVAARAITTNNDGSHVAMGTWGYADGLPSAEDINRPVNFLDVWGHTNFQETVGMSVTMFDEFFFSYMEKITKRLGLLSYGCCEPVHSLWDKCLSRLTNLRKLSFSAWCKEEELAEKIRGKKIVYHRKPSALFIGVDPVFNEQGFAEHIAKSVKAAAGCPLEITFREELTTMNEPWRLTRAVEIVREQFAKHWRP